MDYLFTYIFLSRLSFFFAEQFSDEEHENLEDLIPLPSQPPLSSGNMTNVTDNNPSNFVTVLSLDEIISNRLKDEDRKNYPVFAKYDTGTTTSRLYVKNLSQMVTEADLFAIFGVFSNGPVTDSSCKPRVSLDSTECFSIRLLTEGRMKGEYKMMLSSILLSNPILCCIEFSYKLVVYSIVFIWL